MEFTREILSYPIRAELTPMGEDWLVNITGGCSPHIGSVSTAHIVNGELKLDTLLLPHHRDDVVGDMFARALAERLHTTVTAVCGIHYDGPGREEILQIVDCAKLLLDDVLKAVGGGAAE